MKWEMLKKRRKEGMLQKAGLTSKSLWSASRLETPPTRMEPAAGEKMTNMHANVAAHSRAMRCLLIVPTVCGSACLPASGLTPGESSNSRSSGVRKGWFLHKAFAAS